MDDVDRGRGGGGFSLEDEPDKKCCECMISFRSDKSHENEFTSEQCPIPIVSLK